jgi:sec-independent protein translocase protein TatB
LEFLGIGYQELLLVLVLLLVVVGPERLPALAYQIGRAVRTMQKYARAVRDEFGDEISYVEEQYRVVRGEVDVARQELRDQQREFSAELREATATPDELKAPLLPPGTSTPATNGAQSAAPEAADTKTRPDSGTPPMVF